MTDVVKTINRLREVRKALAVAKRVREAGADKVKIGMHLTLTSDTYPHNVEDNTMDQAFVAAIRAHLAERCAEVICDLVEEEKALAERLVVEAAREALR